MKICPIALQNYQNKLKIFQTLNEHFQNGQSALTFCQKAKFRQIWSHCTTPPIEEKYKKYFERNVSSNCKKDDVVELDSFFTAAGNHIFIR